MQLEVSLGDLCALARMHRQPFPVSERPVGGEPHLVVDDVVEWLSVTGSGHHRDARDDVAA